MVMGYQAYAGNGLLDGITTGVGLRQSYDNMKRQRGLSAGMKKIAEGDESGWADIAENAPELYMKQKQFEANQALADKKLQQEKNGGAWTTDLGRMWSIANDPNQTPENRQMATQYLQYTARNPLANQGWNYAGRVGTLQADLGLGGQVEAEKKKAVQAAEREMDEEQLQRQVPVAMNRINDLKEGLGKDDSGIGPIAGKSPWTTKAGYDNRANVKNAQAQINTAMRGLLKSMGVGSTELNSALEAEAYRYMINQDMPKEQILKVLDNFEKDFISGRLEKDLRSSGYGKTNQEQPKSKYVIEEVIE